MSIRQYRDQIEHLCDSNQLPSDRFIQLFCFMLERETEEVALAMTLESMASFKADLDDIKQRLDKMGLLNKVTYEQL